jgi:fumarylpyruvate hydrolase
MSYAFPIWDIPTVPVHNRNERFPVRHIYCVGRNYAEHALEMGGNPEKEPPFFFTKPFDAIVPVVPPAVGDVRYPMGTKDYHHEIELVVAIGTIGVKVAPEHALSLVYGYAVGLDMTLRDVQAEAKKKGLPWSVAKGFDTSAPVSAIMDKRFVPDPHALKLSLKVNGVLRQCSSTAHMIFRVDFIVSYLSSIFTLEAGDLIFTGTPEGVGQVVPGDVMEAALDSVGNLTVSVESSSTTVHHT